MRYAGIIYNDFAAAPGVCLTFFTQGCPHMCYNCHNHETWDFKGGHEFTYNTITSVIQGLQANEVNRTLCIMGGEPMCQENLFVTRLIISSVKEALPETKIYLWTGYLYDELKERTDAATQYILDTIDVLIDGPYIDSERDITLPLRGSRNQRVITLKQSSED